MSLDEEKAERSVLETVPRVIRRGTDEIRREAALIGRSDLVEALLETSEGLLAVLDDARQILAVNGPLLASMGIEGQEDMLGLRPGEALACAHAKEGADGCGDSEACASCGAVIAIAGCIADSRPVEALCSLKTETNGSGREFLLKIKAKPLSIGAERFVLLYARDETDEERRATLERVFFHDVSNVVTALSSAAFLAGVAEPERRKTALRELTRLSQRLMREIALQRVLVRGATDGWREEADEIEAEAIMRELEDFSRNHPAGEGKRVTTSIEGAPRPFKADYALLLRVLSNMAVNALEASSAGEEIRIHAKEEADSIIFSVANPAFMPEAVRSRVFERHFSTKGGKGRGIGTYSMKLLGEKYLGGRVGFETSAAIGTKFWIELPLSR